MIKKLIGILIGLVLISGSSFALSSVTIGHAHAEKIDAVPLSVLYHPTTTSGNTTVGSIPPKFVGGWFYLYHILYEGKHYDKSIKRWVKNQ